MYSMVNSSLVFMFILMGLAIVCHDGDTHLSDANTQVANWKPQQSADLSVDVKLVDCRHVPHLERMTQTRNAQMCVGIKTPPSYFQKAYILFTKARESFQKLINPDDQILFDTYDNKPGRKHYKPRC